MEACVPPVSIGERMNHADQLVMKPNSNLVSRIGAILYPIASVTEKSRNSVSDFMHEHPNVLFRASIGARPFPSAIEHSSMEFTKIRFGQWVFGSEAPKVEGPLVCVHNVPAFPFVELAFGRQAGNEQR